MIKDGGTIQAEKWQWYEYFYEVLETDFNDFRAAAKQQGEQYERNT